MLSDRVQRQVDRLLDQAEEAIALRQWEDLRATCETLLSLDPDNSDAARYLVLANDSLATEVVSDSSDVAEPAQEWVTQPVNYEDGFCSQITGIDGRINREGFVVRAFLAAAGIGITTLFFIAFIFPYGLSQDWSSYSVTFSLALAGLGFLSFFFMLVASGALIAVLSSVVRRFHDFNWGGVRILLLLVPIVNIAIVFMLLFRSGTQGTNDYGNEPVDLAVGF